MSYSDDEFEKELEQRSPVTDERVSSIHHIIVHAPTFYDIIVYSFF